MRSFIDIVAAHGTEPDLWPTTVEAQATFTKTAILCATRIATSKPYCDLAPVPEVKIEVASVAKEAPASTKVEAPPLPKVPAKTAPVVRRKRKSNPKK